MESEKSKILCPGDIKDRLTVPGNWTEILDKLFNNGGKEALLRVVDWIGNGHIFRCVTRRNGRYRKPVIQAREWRIFVNYAGLQVGDKIIIQEVEESQFREANYRVIAQRLGHNGLWANIQIPKRSNPDLLPLF